MFERRPSNAELEARKVFKPAEPVSNEYDKAQRAFHDNRERLKAERMAREASVTTNVRKDGRST
jgi:hypothetical protein